MTDERRGSVEQFRMAVELVRLEAERLFQIFGAFLLAETVLTGFLLNAASTRERGPYVALGGAVGIAMTAIWWTALQRHTASHRFRMAQANECEPAGWRLLRERGEGFAAGEPVEVGGEQHRFRGWGERLTTRRFVELLMMLFVLAHAALLVVGVVHTFDHGGGSHASQLPHFIS